MKSITQECDACSGTGLYIGMGERDGAAVVCSSCAGEGFYEYQYKEFTDRKRWDEKNVGKKRKVS